MKTKWLKTSLVKATFNLIDLIKGHGGKRVHLESLEKVDENIADCMVTCQK